DMERYRDLWIKHHGYFSTNLVTSRGCPYGCNWCAKPIFGRRYHARSPANVVSEMISLRDEYTPDHFWFADDIFGLKKGWVKQFSELVNSHCLEIPFKCLLRADGVDESLASALKKAGCQTVWIGAESGSQKVLDVMDKGVTVEDTKKATRMLQSAGIDVGFFLQFGYPGEQWEDIFQTIRLVRECMPNDIGISVAYPLPGTPFYDRVQERLGERRNWIDSNDLLVLFDSEFDPEFYRLLHRFIHREYRARRAWRNLGKGNWRNLPALIRASILPFERFQLYRLRRRR
ncbi:MAG TPA: radical SAM protein, partial [Acidobacteriota bacterium]|nr:radical SAM protein [Acidobacteriota bacterium]